MDRLRMYVFFGREEGIGRPLSRLIKVGVDATVGVCSCRVELSTYVCMPFHPDLLHFPLLCP